MSRINIFFKFPLLSNVKLIESHVRKKLLIHFIYACIKKYFKNVKKKFVIKFLWPPFFGGCFKGFSFSSIACMCVMVTCRAFFPP